MNKRELVISALNHVETEKLPYEFSFCMQLHEKMEKLIDIPSEYKNTCISFVAAGSFDEIKKDHFKDEFGVVWNRTYEKDIGVIENFLIDDADNYVYRFPEPDVNENMRRIKQCVNEGKEKGKFTIFGIGFSCFERAWSLRGMENILIDMLENPEFLHKLLDDITSYNLKCLEPALADKDIDGIYFGDDWGQQKGLIMGAGHWREFIKPCMKKMYAAVKAAGKYVIQHSCGDIHEIFPDLIEIGLNVYQTFQPEIYDIGLIKKQFGDKLSFWGGISTQRLLPKASPAVIKDEVRRIAGIMRKGGGYILAPTHCMPGDIPPENVKAMLEAFKEFG